MFAGLLIMRKKREEISAEEIFHRAKKGDKAALQAFALAGIVLTPYEWAYIINVTKG